MDDIGVEDVREAVEGDRRALERIIRKIEAPLLGLARRMMRSHADAEDATQECLVRVATHLSEFRGESKFSTWVWTVAVRRIVELRRQRERTPGVTFEQYARELADGLEMEAPERAEDSMLVGEVKMMCGRALLQCLDVDHRAAYIVGDILDLDGPEAADILETEPATFRKRLSRARERVRAALDGNCGILNPDAPCRCHRRLTPALAKGRVVPGRPSTEEPLDVAAFTAHVTRIVESRRVAAYFQAEPRSRPSRDLVRAALAPLLQTSGDANEN
jgi:RNA polymerase sigma factor (sigma-70 family)